MQPSSDNSRKPAAYARSTSVPLDDHAEMKPHNYQYQKTSSTINMGEGLSYKNAVKASTDKPKETEVKPEAAAAGAQEIPTAPVLNTPLEPAEEQREASASGATTSTSAAAVDEMERDEGDATQRYDNRNKQGGRRSHPGSGRPDHSYNPNHPKPQRGMHPAQQQPQFAYSGYQNTPYLQQQQQQQFYNYVPVDPNYYYAAQNMMVNPSMMYQQQQQAMRSYQMPVMQAPVAHSHIVHQQQPTMPAAPVAMPPSNMAHPMAGAVPSTGKEAVPFSPPPPAAAAQSHPAATSATQSPQPAAAGSSTSGPPQKPRKTISIKLKGDTEARNLDSLKDQLTSKAPAAEEEAKSTEAAAVEAAPVSAPVPTPAPAQAPMEPTIPDIPVTIQKKPVEEVVPPAVAATAAPVPPTAAEAPSVPALVVTAPSALASAAAATAAVGTPVAGPSSSSPSAAPAQAPSPPGFADASPAVGRKELEVGTEDAEPVVARRLVPGGKTGGLKVLNQGPSPSSHKRYTRSELLALRPPEDSVPKISLMGPIVVDGSQGGPGGSHKGGGFGYKGASGKESRDRDRDRDRVAANSPVGQGEVSEWSKEALPSNARKVRAVPAGPMPKKVVSDPLEKLTLEVTAILNKITPQTFEKLSQQILDIKLEDTSQLDRVVQIIFEKAVQEPNFTSMYADLCLMLKEQSSWVFFTVIKRMDSENGEYFWIRDFSFPEEAISFFSRSDCMSAIKSNMVTQSEDLQVKPLTASLAPESIEYILYKNVLYRVGQNLTKNNWFLTFLPLDEVAEEKRGQTLFSDPDAAKKDAIGEVSFRGRLAHSCEREFAVSVKNDNIERLAQELRDLQALRGTMPEEEFMQKSEEIEEQRGKLKRRMLGNIRFVGELYKKKLLNTDTMHDCIGELLGQPGQWKESYEDADLELLCRFLKTVGESLESKSMKHKSKPELGVRFNQYFERMAQLTKDKNVNSRIRFHIEEVIALREAKWQARREQEGPKKISEIHQQVQAEQNKLIRQSSMGSVGSAGSNSMGGGPSRMASKHDSGDARAMRGAGGASTAAGGGARRGDRDDNRDNRGERRGDRGGSERDNRDNRDNRRSNTSSPMTQAARPAKAAPAAVKESYTFEDSHMKNKVHSSLEEFMHGESISEVKAMLSEGSVVLAGYLLQVVIDKYLNATQQAQKDRVLTIMDDSDLIKTFVDNKQVVDAALESCEPFKTLVGMVCEVADAPQRIAKIISRLIKHGAVRLERVQALAEAFKAYNIQEDFDSPDMCEQCFAKFLSALEV